MFSFSVSAETCVKEDGSIGVGAECVVNADKVPSDSGGLPDGTCIKEDGSIGVGAECVINADQVVSSEDCGVLGSPSNKNTIAYYLQVVFNLIKFAGPILVILFTIKEFVVLIAEQKLDSEMTKVGQKTLKRVIYAILLFFIPSLLNVILDFAGLYGTCLK